MNQNEGPTSVPELDESLLQVVVAEVDQVPPRGFPAGLMEKRIREQGFFEEADLRFDREDGAHGLLYAGLSVLARDVNLLLAGQARDDTALFGQVVARVHESEAEMHGGKAFPGFDGLPIESLPSGLTRDAEQGRPDLARLNDLAIVHEWTLKSGKRLFVEFGRELRTAVCGPHGPLDDLERGRLTAAGSAVFVASHVLTAGFSVATIWYPIAAYIAVLIVRTGLKQFCAGQFGASTDQPRRNDS